MAGVHASAPRDGRWRASSRAKPRTPIACEAPLVGLQRGSQQGSKHAKRIGKGQNSIPCGSAIATKRLMTERENLLRALKQVLKQRGMRYADLAAGLGISEPTVKRMLSTGRIDLERLERICGLLEIDLFELVRLARGTRAKRAQLAAAQERALADEPRLLLVFHLLCNDWTVAAIRREFALGGPETTLLLARLDRLGLVELLPRDRVRLRVARDFEWREGGPVRRRYAQVAVG